MTLHLCTPHTKITAARDEATACPTYSICNSIPFSAATASSPCSLACTNEKESVGVGEPAEKRLLISDQRSGPTEEEIGGILAYLKDGAPLATPPRSTTFSDPVNCSPVCERKATDTQTTDITHNINSDQPAVANLSIDDKLAEEVKEFVISCGHPSLEQGVSYSHDLEEWLYLELFDDVNTEESFGNDVTSELTSVLISDCQDTKLSFNELNCSSALGHVCKNADVSSQTTSKGNALDSFPDNELLKPAEDWNQWNEPSYVERMISLCNSLNYSRRINVIDSEGNNGGKIKVGFGTDHEVCSLSRGNTSKKIQVKRLTPAGRVHKNNKGMKSGAKGKKIMSVVADHRRSYARRFAAVQKTPSAGKYSYWNTWKMHRDAGTPQSHLKKCCKSPRIRSSEMLQLIVSISFDCLVTERQLKKYHIKQSYH